MRRWRHESTADTPLDGSRGFLVPRADLPRYPRRYRRRGRLSPGVRRGCPQPVPVCPTVRQRPTWYSDPQARRPSGVHAPSREVLRCAPGSSLTAIRSCFYPKERFTLEPPKHDWVVKCARTSILETKGNVKCFGLGSGFTRPRPGKGTSFIPGLKAYLLYTFNTLIK